MRHFATPVAALTALAPGLAPAAAQEVPVRTLDRPAATYPEGLGSLRGIRELPDGRVLIADGLGKALIVWDPSDGGDTLTNVGQGPGEYRLPDALHPLPGGATLLVDIGNARLQVIGSDLAFGASEPIARPDAGDGLRLVLPVGTDERGRIYYEQRPRSGRGATPDSATIRRLDPDTGEDVALGKRKLQTVSATQGGGAGAGRVIMRPLPLTPQDAWAPAADGRVAVARADGYHLEWRHPDGSVVRGPRVPAEPVRVREADKEAWVASLATGGLGVTVAADGSGPRTSFTRGGGRGGETSVDDFDWPRTKPPFPGGALAVAPDGRAWVRRHVPAADPPTFDLFDARGRRVAQVRLPEGRSLVGFGSGGLYVRRTDDLGFEWLERYALPSP